MTDLPESKRKILESAAEAEREKRLSDHDVRPVCWEDIVDDFHVADFGVNPTIYVPPRMDELFKSKYLDRTSPSAANTPARYWLSEKGWNTVDVPEPDD